jgi:DNA-directed RNA polymerase subunit RPC12/RpoP
LSTRLDLLNNKLFSLKTNIRKKAHYRSAQCTTKEKIIAIKKGKNMVKIGEEIRCPKCYTKARIVWISKDSKTAGIKCPASHRQLSRSNSSLGSATRPQSKWGKNMVFLVDIK